MAQATASRRAQLSDAGDIARIYSEGIADRIATFEMEPRSRADVEQVLRGLDPRHPAVVVEREGRVVAFAWTSTYRPRACYDLIAEGYIDAGQGLRPVIAVTAKGRQFVKDRPR